MALTGRAEGAPLLAPAPLAARAARLVAALDALDEGDAYQGLDGARLLGEHAACMGHSRHGDRSPGGSCRLLRAADGWLALNLARADDRDLLPAWLGPGDLNDAWGFVSARLREQPVDPVVERGRLLGLPLARALAPPAQPPPWLRFESIGPPAADNTARAPLVVDLTSLWAGPLCGHLLQLGGAQVLKVESVALDFGSGEGSSALRALVERADVVLESTRPRALRQLGIDAAEWLAARSGRVWTSVTGYGRREPEAGWVAFGDDAAVAAGLAVATGSEQAPLFCGDAIADPLAGMHAAVATRAAWFCGGGVLLDVSLRDGVAHLLSDALGVREGRVEATDTGHQVVVGGERETVLPPAARRLAGRAAALGADNARVRSQSC
jgi:hypothetical protein